ncbi:MAG: tetratricopeptide repeat protein [Candidatus Obscuribacter sp.]|nr:tetratricopeptide repeat protein [Candidatus Obscuribacter sp.]
MPAEHHEIADCDNILGSIYQAQDKPKESVAYYRQALAIRTKLLNVGHPDIKITEDNLNQVLKLAQKPQ